MHYVYVLFSLKDSKLYTGYTKDLRRRFAEHQSGRSEATRRRRPFKLIYYEAYPTGFEARRREKYLKGGNGRSGLKKALSTTLGELGYLEE